MAVYITPLDQQIYVSPYFQNKFSFGNASDDVRICRYINHILDIFGEDLVIYSGRARNISISPSNIITVDFDSGKLIQDKTLIPFDSFQLTKDVTGYFGDTSSELAIKIRDAVNLIGEFTASAIGNEIYITNNNVGDVTDITDGNTGFTFSVMEQGDISTPETSKIICNDSYTFDPSAYFLLSSTTTDYYIWFNTNSASTDPEIAGRTGIEVQHKRGSYVIVYTDFQYNDSDRNVTIDPNTFYFKIGIVDVVTHDLINSIWDTNTNRILMCAYDLDLRNFVTPINIEGNILYSLGHDDRYMYFTNIVDGGEM